MFNRVWAALWLSYAFTTVARNSAGCQASSHDASIDHASPLSFKNRTYHLSFPKDFDHRKPADLILALHDRGTSIQEFEEMAHFDDPELKSNAIVVYPSALDGLWLADGRDGPANNDKHGTNDVRYITSFLDHIQDSHCINLDHIYTAGLGTGGGMAHILACDRGLSRRIAAFAMVSGAFWQDLGSRSPWRDCEIGRKPIPILEIHGVKDTRWQYWPANVKEQRGPVIWLKNWSEMIGCGKDTKEEVKKGEKPASFVTMLKNGRLVEAFEYAGAATSISFFCPARNKGDAEVFTAVADVAIQHYQLKDGTYGWHRKEFTADREVDVLGEKVKAPGKPYFDTTKVVLDWFKAHPLPSMKEMWHSMRDETAEKLQEHEL